MVAAGWSRVKSRGCRGRRADPIVHLRPAAKRMRRYRPEASPGAESLGDVLGKLVEVLGRAYTAAPSAAHRRQ